MVRRIHSDRPVSGLETGLLKDCRLLEIEAASYGDARKNAGQIEALATRQRELSDVVENLERLVDVVRLLRPERQVARHVASLAALTEDLHKKAVELGKEAAGDVLALGRPRALDAFTRSNVFKQVEAELDMAWREFVHTEEHAGLENVLTRFPGMRESGKKIAAYRERLLRATAELPASQEEVEEVRRLKAAMLREIRNLEGKGLDEQVLAFLRQSVEGVPLQQVLDDERLLTWLKEHNLLSEFAVKAQ